MFSHLPLVYWSTSMPCLGSLADMTDTSRSGTSPHPQTCVCLQVIWVCFNVCLACLSCLCVCFLWAGERENICQMHQNLFNSDQKMHELIKNWQHSIVWHDELKLHLVDILPAGEDIVFSILLLSFVWLLPSFVICNCKMILCVCTTCSKEHLSWRPRKKHKQDVGKKREEERGGF